METKAHWEQIYQTKQSTQVSWYQMHPLLSLRFIQRTGVDKAGSIIDVGGGTSTLVDRLLTDGYQNVAVLDVSGTALEQARGRLGLLAESVNWIEADITEAALPPNQYDVWHDRAVFHFLTEPEGRRRYVEMVRHSVKPGGHVIVATFATDGPEQCSGLNVARYSADSLHGEFGSEFELLESAPETHQTPFGTQQKFVYCYCRKE